MQKGLIVHALISNNNGEVLILRRSKLNDVLMGYWDIPGGTLEDGEDPAAGAIRETQEETGFTIRRPRFITFVNDIVPESGIHWITLYFRAEYTSGEPRTAEGEIGDWSWYAWDSLPRPLFTPTRNFVRSGYNPST